MQRVLGAMRRAVTDYSMLQNGDRLAVGVSGGKDSLVLLAGLFKLREFTGINFSLAAISVDPCFYGVEADYSEVSALCESFGAPHIIKRSELWEILFVTRKEKNPCSLCARMRRGMLHDLCKQHGCNKLALGHHKNDAVETFVMNMFYEGRLASFQPVSYLSRKDLTMLRPLCLCDEKDIRSAAISAGLPVMGKSCPADGCTARQKIKDWLVSMEKGGYPGLSKKLFGAMARAGISGWR